MDLKPHRSSRNLAYVVIWKNRMSAKNTKWYCGTHPLYTARESGIPGNQTKLHFPFQTHEAARFPGQISCTLSFFLHLLPRNLSLFVCLWRFIKWPQCLLPLVIKTTSLYMGIFVKVHHLLISMRHRLTVAGNNERLFYLLFFLLHL